MARARGLGRVEIDVDDVVERADGDADGLAQFFVVERAVLASRWVSRTIEPRLQTAVSSAEVLSVISVQRFDCVDDADVVLRAADVARVLEGDPRMAGLEEHLEHLLPQIERRHLLAEDFAARGLRLVLKVAFLERAAVEFMEVGRFVRRGRASTSRASRPAS